MNELKIKSNPDAKIFLIGNKCDLKEKRKISKERAENFAKSYGFDFFTETSAKTGLNAKEIFKEAALMLYSDYCEYENSNIKKEGFEIKINENKFEENESELERREKKCC